jgi:hypothetical protein
MLKTGFFYSSFEHSNTYVERIGEGKTLEGKIIQNEGLKSALDSSFHSKLAQNALCATS